VASEPRSRRLWGDSVAAANAADGYLVVQVVVSPAAISDLINFGWLW